MTDERRRLGKRGRHVVVGLGCMAAFVAVFLVVTSFTGFPGPGILRRYPVDELETLAQHVNTSSGFVGTYPEPRPARAGVDLVRSRVWIDGEVPCGVLVAKDLDLLRDEPEEGPCGDI
jgi:hypothetical protein